MFSNILLLIVDYFRGKKLIFQSFKVVFKVLFLIRTKILEWLDTNLPLISNSILNTVFLAYEAVGLGKGETLELNDNTSCNVAL